MKKIKRGSGILLHVTSLPSPYGIGDFGSGAYKFTDFLAETKQSFWQVLPLTSIDPTGNPYFSSSAFAGNKLLISPELLLGEGLLAKEDVEPVPSFPKDRVNYPEVIPYKEKLFSRAHERFKKNVEDRGEYDKFCSENSSWLEEFSLFVALKDKFSGRSWSEWPPEVRDRDPNTLQILRNQLQEKIEHEKFLQYIFFKQWFLLKHYCNQKGIQVIGDLPIYMDYDSVDVWTNPGMFKLDREKRPTVVSGVPPDYFSETGQLWGNPVYRWDVLKENGYAWWCQRVEHNLRLFDLIRIDHFRGFVAYWEVPADEKTAVNGRWVKGPAEDFFTTLLKRFHLLPVIAEDLGIITPDVRKVMRSFGFPGMRVLLFAFGEDFPMSLHLPHKHVRNCVACTGTHDTNTVRGWFEREATPENKERLFRYLGREASVQEVHLEFIRLAMMSVADMAIFPMQDILGLGEEARMNRPATTEGNWVWRLSPECLTPSLTGMLLNMVETYRRART